MAVNVLSEVIYKAGAGHFKVLAPAPNKFFTSVSQKTLIMLLLNVLLEFLKLSSNFLNNSVFSDCLSKLKLPPLTRYVKCALPIQSDGTTNHREALQGLPTFASLHTLTDLRWKPPQFVLQHLSVCGAKLDVSPGFTHDNVDEHANEYEP
jgi:hypothetical protein